MPFADHDDVVQALTSNRADHPLGIRVLPRRTGRNDGLLEAQHPGLMRKSFSIDLVPVPNQIPGADERPPDFIESRDCGGRSSHPPRDLGPPANRDAP